MPIQGLTFSIRRATERDAPGILACLGAAFEPYREWYTPDAYLNTVLTPKALTVRLATMCIFVAESESGEIVGTLTCHLINGDEGHLRGMAVLPKWQGCGVAERLLRSAETELRDRKCARVTLDTSEPLKRATRFYVKNGYSPSGRVRDSFGMLLFEYVKPLH